MNRLILLFGIVAAIVPLEAQPGGRDAGAPLQGAQGEYRVVKGKPFSATEERHSLQVLGDGTRIETSQANRLYRDNEGRSRLEEMNGTITIYDPVTKLRWELDPAAKTAHKANTYLVYDANHGTTRTFSGGWGLPFQVAQNVPAKPAALTGVTADTTENLAAQTINGVIAQGFRTTMTIPKGQIGNNRDIKVVNERWFSNDLQILVKSVNSDPRFGDSTYQVTKIVQSAPDPALFQIPSDYTVSDQSRPSLKRQ